MKHSGSARRRRRQPYAWLGAGAVTLGIGAALASGSAVAYADTGAGSGAGKVSSASSESGSTSSAPATAKKATAHSPRQGAITSSGGNVSSRKAASAAASDAPEPAAVDATAHSARVKTLAEAPISSGSDSSSATAAVSAANPTPSSTSWLPSEPPVVASVAVDLARGYIAQAQADLQHQTWGSGNIVAGLVSVVPQVLLAQAALSLNTWEASIAPAQSLYARTYGVPIVHELAGMGLLGAVLLPTLATTALNSAGLILPLVGALGVGDIAPIQNAVSTAALNGRVYGFVQVSMRANTEPIVYISVNGGPSIPVLVDTGSSGLVLTRASVGNAVPLGAPTATTTVRYSGDDTLLIHLTTYSTTVDFGSGIISEPTNVDIVDDADAQKALAFFNLLGGASGILGIGANSGGPGPAGLPTTSLPGDLSQGVFLYQGAFLGLAGVMVLGPNPMPSRASVSGAPDAYLNVRINNGSATQVGAIIDSGGVYGTILLSQVGISNTHLVTYGDEQYRVVNSGVRISGYTPDGVLLYSYVVTSQNSPTVIDSGLINTGYVPYQQGPVYLDYTTPDGMGSTHFDYR
ncbi:PecA family PE domain-processing aspartic protease [Mycolicibacterium sp. Dal123E01]|uniref:PecA family PE domain-processing aspartic protease n=1 Tax=Mycolicibacterium sp. Dal123E01 TaxID=3457578 RepID=UPI00403E6909